MFVAILLLALLILLFLGAIYLGNSQKTPNRRPRSAQDDLTLSHGMGNVYSAREAVDALSGSGRRRGAASRGRRR